MNAANVLEVSETRAPVIVSIFGIHATRIGLPRAAVGGGAMYLTIPLFVFLHLTVVVFLYRLVLAPALGLPRLDVRNYIILDRHAVQGLHWFDKFNCWFCGYANGIIRLMNDELDALASSEARAPLWALPFIELYALVNVAFLLVGLVMTTVVLNVLAKVLGLHRGSLRRINAALRAEGYAQGYHPVHRELIVFYKVVAAVIAFNLEQIESAWCPLTHLHREGQVLPVHHDRFHDRGDLETMVRALSTHGTVSEKLPKW